MDDVTKSLNVTLSQTLADGHCFLHAVALQLNETPNSMQVYEFLMQAIETESRTNKKEYTNFIDEGSGKLDILVHKSLHGKIFDHVAGDLIPQITSNALQKPIHIYSERDGGIHQLGLLVSESACERKDPGPNPAADMVDAARNTAWDMGKQPNNYRSNYPTQEWARRFVPIASFYSIRKTIVQSKITQQINKSPLLVHLKDYHYSALINEKNASISKTSSSR
ncbi:OTU domain [Trinorchestia longiramus]|nr:OTU domain [Trinorchestia longiramus]